MQYSQNCYKFKGWNSDGIPTKESLDELGLGYVSEDFIQRRILTDGEDAPCKETPAEKRKYKVEGVNLEG